MVDSAPAPRNGVLPPRQPRVAVVGHCASGKTTLVGALRERGYDAFAVAQEHSGVPALWRHAAPDVLIYLDVPLGIVRERRGETWPRVVYDAQEMRLADARAHADLVLDSGCESASQVVAHAVSFLQTTGYITGDGLYSEGA